MPTTDRSTDWCAPVSYLQEIVVLRGSLPVIADALLAEMEAQLGAAGPLFGGAAVNATDVLATVFLARLRFCRQGRRIGARPAVAAYWDRVHGRPSFRQADVWDRLRPSLVLRLIG